MYFRDFPSSNEKIINIYDLLPTHILLVGDSPQYEHHMNLAKIVKELLKLDYVVTGMLKISDNTILLDNGGSISTNDNFEIDDSSEIFEDAIMSNSRPTSNNKHDKAVMDQDRVPDGYITISEFREKLSKIFTFDWKGEVRPNVDYGKLVDDLTKLQGLLLSQYAEVDHHITIDDKLEHVISIGVYLHVSVFEVESIEIDIVASTDACYNFGIRDEASLGGIVDTMLEYARTMQAGIVVRPAIFDFM